MPDGDSAYLTNAPINPRCTVTPALPAAMVVCPGDATAVNHLARGQVQIEVAMYYQPFEGPTRDDLDIDGYRARIATGPAATASCDIRNSTRPVEVTLTPRTSAVQPALLYLTACFGPEANTVRRNFRAMLPSATIHRRPDEAVPVPGAPPCTRAKLHVYQARGQGVSSAESLVAFGLTNVGSRTCRLSGYPRTRLVTSDRHVLGFTFRHDPLFAPQLFLRDGDNAYFQLDVPTCLYAPHVRTARLAQIRLPQVAGEFEVALTREGVPYCGTQRSDDVIGVDPLTGN